MYFNPFQNVRRGIMQSRFNISKLILHSFKGIIYRLRTYFKSVVVRHPFDRLLSGYKDKLASSNKIYEHGLGQRILRMFHPTLDESVIEEGKGVTFPDFVKYFISKGHRTRDAHFSYMHDLCYLCQIPYDYIAKLETHDSDAYNIITTRLSGNGLDSLTAVHSTTGGASVGKALPQYSDVSDEDIEALSQLFSEDMHLFGYTLDKDE